MVHFVVVFIVDLGLSGPICDSPALTPALYPGVETAGVLITGQEAVFVIVAVLLTVEVFLIVVVFHTVIVLAAA